MAEADGQALDRLYRPQALDVPVMVSRDGPIAAIDPRTGGAIGLAENAAGAAGDDPVADSVEAAIQVIEADAPPVELLAVRPSWVRVTAADGTVLFEKILDAGERYVVPADGSARDAARRKLRFGLFRGERPDLRPRRSGGAGGQERGAVARGADGELPVGRSDVSTPIWLRLSRSRMRRLHRVPLPSGNDPFRLALRLW